MIKKHFVEAAKIVSGISNDQERKMTAIRFATLFRKFNERFDNDKFFKACKVKE